MTLLPNRQTSLRAGHSVVAQIATWASERLSAPSRLLNGAQGFVEWGHYPQPDAVDPNSGWRFYYHAHPPTQRLSSEHGHFHIFTPGPEGKATADVNFSHLIAISTDLRGLPLRLFTTNRWVTNEVWQSAEAMVRLASVPALGHAEPRDVGMWLNNLVMLFAEDIIHLLRARDSRIANSRSRAPLEDHRLRIPSQRRINLARRLQMLEA